MRKKDEDLFGEENLEEDLDDDVYKKKFIEELLENDEISSREEAFMLGYNS